MVPALISCLIFFPSWLYWDITYISSKCTCCFEIFIYCKMIIIMTVFRKLFHLLEQTSIFIFKWNILDLQCCVNFSCIAKWLIYINININIIYININIYKYTYNNIWTYMYVSLFHIFPLTGYYKILSVYFPMIYSTSSLLIYFLYSNMYMLNSNP